MALMLPVTLRSPWSYEKWIEGVNEIEFSNLTKNREEGDEDEGDAKQRQTFSQLRCDRASEGQSARGVCGG